MQRQKTGLAKFKGWEKAGLPGFTHTGSSLGTHEGLTPRESRSCAKRPGDIHKNSQGMWIAPAPGRKIKFKQIHGSSSDAYLPRKEFRTRRPGAGRQTEQTRVGFTKVDVQGNISFVFFSLTRTEDRGTKGERQCDQTVFASLGGGGAAASRFQKVSKAGVSRESTTKKVCLLKRLSRGSHGNGGLPESSNLPQPRVGDQDDHHADRVAELRTRSNRVNVSASRKGPHQSETGG